MGEDRPKSCNRTKGARRLQRRGNNLLTRIPSLKS